MAMVETLETECIISDLISKPCRLKSELLVFKDKPIFEIIKFMRLNNLDLGLKEAYKLAKLLATIPSTTAPAERKFSALRRIKS